MMRALLFAASLLISTAPAFADEQYKTTIVAIAGSPVQVNACEAWVRDWNKTVLTAHAVMPKALFDTGVDFTNKAARKLKDVQFGFTAYDAFGSVVSSIKLAVSQDSLADKLSKDPGAVIDLMGPKGWHGKNSHTAKDHVVCSVEKVTFDDGSVWVTPSPAPTVSPN